MTYFLKYLRFKICGFFGKNDKFTYLKTKYKMQLHVQGMTFNSIYSHIFFNNLLISKHYEAINAFSWIF